MANPSRHTDRSGDGDGDGDGWASPERTMVWTEAKQKKQKKKQMKQQVVVVGVVYYLCRQDGQLDHPHFVHVHVPCLSDSDSDPPRPRLHLRDFVARLSELRGAAMPAAYSWSAKRTYRRNAGYVWQDLTADDLILPASNHHDYVLKGSPLLLPDDSTAPPQLPNPNKHKRWTSLDLVDYHHHHHAAQLIGIDEISSPPTSSSSPDDTTLQQQEEEAAAGRLIIGGGRMRASAMLMQLISCGGSAHHKELQDGQGQPQRRPPPSASDAAAPHCNNVKAHERDSLVEKNSSKTPISAGIDLSQLRRSSSCNASRGATSRLGVLPRKHKQQLHDKSTAPCRRDMA